MNYLNLLRKGITFFILTFFAICVVHAQNCPAAATGKNFSGRNLTDSNFTVYPAGALVGANFTNAILNGAQFQNVNLTNANFSGASMRRSAKGAVDLSGAILDHTCFQNAGMDSANLQFATFKATDFTNASLLASDFGPMMTIQGSPDSLRTKFVNTTTDYNHFPINNWPAVYWAYTDLSYSRISGMNSFNFSFNNKDISWAILRGLNFTNFDFRKTKMSGADLSGATLNYALMDSAVMDRIKLVGAKMNYTQATGVKFYNPDFTGKFADLSGAAMNNATLRLSDFSYANMQGAIMIGVTADSCIFNNTNFESGTTYNVAILSGAILSNSSFNSAKLNGVNLSNSYIINGQFNNLTMEGTNFSDATMPGANFKSSVLEGVIFTGAVLQDVNFTQATMKTAPTGGSGVDLSCSQLGGSNFSNATVLQANFSDAVMPAADSCCQKLDGPFCGIVAINQLAYGAVTFPVLNNAVTCPNGENAKCSGAQWEIPLWRSANCNSKHVMQVLWYKPSCSGHDTTGIINFPDPNLQACIFNQLSGGNSDFVITKDVAAQVVSLNCPGSNISNLEGLQYFTALEQLNLTYNKLVDGSSFFTRLPTLHTLKVADNNISILNLQGLSNLNVLDASNNRLTSVLFDASSYLNYLDLSYNVLSQLDLSYQNSLNYLDVSNNKLTTVGDLSRLNNVSSLFLQNNSLKTIGNIEKLYNNGAGNLLYMDVACNLPFECNTLGLNNTPQELDFLSHTLCGVNNLPRCNVGPFYPGHSSSNKSNSSPDKSDSSTDKSNSSPDKSKKNAKKTHKPNRE